jgi:predicted short-subunit dehydrogenase-like oxidoreductase (DUF2520 family)
MQIGIIGAGKVGYTLGKYFALHGFFVCGYYSRSKASAQDAAEFTQSKYYDNISDLVMDSDMLFFTVPDKAVCEVWVQVKDLPISGKIICHASGALSCAVFEGIEETGAYGYSVHPFFAVSDRYHSYETLGNALFTVEGAKEQIGQVRKLLKTCGNPVVTIGREDKTRYHAAASIASNLVVGLIDLAEDELRQCGFTEEEARKALAPLALGNMQSVMEKGCMEALTGPAERADVQTIEGHLSVLEGEDADIYRLLTKRLLAIAAKKNPDRDYTLLKEGLS